MLLDRPGVAVYEFGQFRLDLVVRQLFCRGKQIPLSPSTFDILKMLLENRGQVVTKQALIKRVWPDRFIGENNLTVRMSALRKALGENSENRFIETVSGYGYRFVAKTRVVFNENGKSQEEALNSLAVLPLVNLHNQQRLNYLCDGISESLITSLSQIANLKVMARSTVFRYKGGSVDPRKIGENLGVKAVLTGKVSQVANTLIFDVEMMDVRDGVCLWSARYKRQVSNLFTLQEELTREISENLRVKLSKVEENKIVKRYTYNAQAYILYLKGRYFWNKRSVAGLKKAVKCFRGAIRLDPRYSLAHVGLADAYFLLSMLGLWPTSESIMKAKTAALKALEIDGQLAEAHVSLANIKSSYEFDWPRAENEFKLAIELNPSSELAHYYYSTFLAKFGRLDQALAEVNKAYEIDPLSLHISLAMGKMYYFAGRYYEAIRKGREMLEIDPQFGQANGLIGLAYLEMGLYQDAEREFKVLVESLTDQNVIKHRRGETPGESAALPDSDPEAIALLGYTYAVSGKRNNALEVLNKLQELIKRRYVEPHTLAIVHIGLGDNDKAFECLDRAFEDRCSILTYIKVIPLFDGLKSDPRYDKLVRCIGLPT